MKDWSRHPDREGEIHTDVKSCVMRVTSGGQTLDYWRIDTGACIGGGAAGNKDSRVTVSATKIDVKVWLRTYLFSSAEDNPELEDARPILLKFTLRAALQTGNSAVFAKNDFGLHCWNREKTFESNRTSAEELHALPLFQGSDPFESEELSSRTRELYCQWSPRLFDAIGAAPGVRLTRSKLYVYLLPNEDGNNIPRRRLCIVRHLIYDDLKCSTPGANSVHLRIAGAPNRDADDSELSLTVPSPGCSIFEMQLNGVLNGQDDPPEFNRDELRLVGVTNIPGKHMLDMWNRDIARRYQGGIRTIRGERPHSFMPEWLDITPDTLAAPISATALYIAGRKDLNDISITPELKLAHDCGTLVPGTILELWGGATYSVPPQAFHVSAALPRLRNHNNVPLSLLMRFRSELSVQKFLRDRLSPNARYVPVFSYVTKILDILGQAPVDGTKLDRVRTVRLGAFDLELTTAPANSPGNDSERYVRVFFSPESTGQSPRYSLHIEMEAKLGLSRFAVAAQDRTEFEQVLDEDEFIISIAPLVIPLQTPPKPQQQLSLHVVESAKPDARQRLQLHVETNHADASIGAQEVCIIDSEPFMVAKVGFPALKASGTNSRVASYDSDSVEGAMWFLLADRSLVDENGKPLADVTLTLPPQAVGESMEKLKGQAYKNEADFADFRFGRPTVLKLWSTWRSRERSYVEPPQNLRRIFGDPTQRAPGAPLESAEIELLYGLKSNVEAAGKFLVSELTSEFGMLPSLLPEIPLCSVPNVKQIEQGNFVDAYMKFRRNWKAVHLAFQRRLAVLSVRSKDGQPAKLTEDIHVELRKDAETRAPVALDEELYGPDTRGPYENVSGKRAGLESNDLLPGGAEWGFESSEIYRSVWTTPTQYLSENTGVLEDVHFSALGGWGKQKAYFDRRKTAIISHTTMGRTHYYSLERVGRIARYWHRAKHVIEYERTVLPSEQFYGRQSNLFGRAVPRKVREYVEIQVPLRRYPEDGNATHECGCVEGCEFRTVIIPVDTSWGEDMPHVGWRVPLWNLRASEEKPKVYPKPRISVWITRRTESGFGTGVDDIDDPENVWFFTSTNPEHDDNTDKWPAIRDVDFVDLPAPAPENVSSIHADTPDARLAPARPVPAGWALMTNRLEGKGGFSAEIMAGRASGDTPSAVLKSITMVRALPGVRPADAELAKFADLLKTAHEVATDTAEEVERNIQRVRTLVRDKVIAAKEHIGDEIEKLAENGVIRESKSKLDNAINEINEVTAKLGNPCEVLRAKAKKVVEISIERLQKGVLDREALLDRLFADFDTVADLQNERHERAKQLVNEFFDRVYMLFNIAGTPLDEVRNAIEAVPAKPLGSTLERYKTAFVDQALAKLKREDDRLRAAADSFETRMLGEFDTFINTALRRVSERLPKAGERLTAAVGTARADLMKRLRNARTVLDNYLDNLADTTEENVLDAYRRLLDAFASIDERVNELSGEVKTGLASLDDFVDEVRKQVIHVRDEVLLAIGNTGEINWGELKRFVRNKLVDEPDSVLKRLENGLLDKVNEALGAICGPLVGGENYISDLINDARTKIIQEWASIADRIRAAANIDAGLLILDEQVHVVTRTVDRATECVINGVRELKKDVQLALEPKQVLVMLRAFGDAPVVPGLEFNRPQIGYYFDPIRNAVKTTPVAALLDRAGADLKSFGIRLPVEGMVNDFIPKLPEPFSLSTLFPDFAGIKLDGLFPGLSASPEVRDKVKVTHGFDRDARRGWIQAKVDSLRIGAKADLFSLGPIRVSLQSGRFDATARIEGGANGGMTKRVSGQIIGNWALAFGGTTIVEFVDTPLLFKEDGKFKFDLRPENVRMQGALTMLESFINAFSSPSADDSSGLKISFLRDANKIPVGVDCLLDIALPPMTFGAFGISGLRFGAGMHVRAYPHFEIGARLFVGSKKTPFTLTVFILGGSGFIVGGAWYRPLTGELYAEIEVFIAVSATLGFSFGPIRGSVAVYAGVHAHMLAKRGGGTRYTIGLLIIIRGDLSVFGLVSVCLEISLEASVEGGKKITGRGQVSVTVKLGFLKKSFSASLTYTLGGGSSTESIASDETREIARRHLAMLV